MTKETIHYEQPLNERIRTFLRLEDLFARTTHTLTGESIWDTRSTLSSMIEILNIFERGDLKSEVIKELERHISNIQRLQQSPNVDINKCQEILDTLQRHVDKLTSFVGKFGHHLKDNELITTVRQRISIPGGTCNFDIPVYHYWLQQPAETRISTLRTWLSGFSLIDDALSLLLSLIRDSASPQKVQAETGFYQKPLEPSTPCQLVRITIPAFERVFPEVSGGKHRISVRFLDYNGHSRPTQTEQTVQFELSCCFI